MSKNPFIKLFVAVTAFTIWGALPNPARAWSSFIQLDCPWARQVIVEDDGTRINGAWSAGHAGCEGVVFTSNWELGTTFTVSNGFDWPIEGSLELYHDGDLLVTEPVSVEPHKPLPIAVAPLLSKLPAARRGTYVLRLVPKKEAPGIRTVSTVTPPVTLVQRFCKWNVEHKGTDTTTEHDNCETFSVSPSPQLWSGVVSKN